MSYNTIVINTWAPLPLKVSNSDAKDSICNRAGLQAVFASAAVLLHSEHSL